ncbi:MAG: hypothetical protein V1838_04175 [Patescibacteria group bacterium]
MNNIFNIVLPECIRCGVVIPVYAHRCPECDYAIDEILRDTMTKYFLEKEDYSLSLLFFPNLMMNDFRKFQEYAMEIRQKLITFAGRNDLANLTKGRRDGWIFDPRV